MEAPAYTDRTYALSKREIAQQLLTDHYHVTEELGDVHSDCHVRYDLLNGLEILLRIALVLRGS